MDSPPTPMDSDSWYEVQGWIVVYQHRGILRNKLLSRKKKQSPMRWIKRTLNRNTGIVIVNIISLKSGSLSMLEETDMAKAWGP